MHGDDQTPRPHGKIAGFTPLVYVVTILVGEQLWDWLYGSAPEAAQESHGRAPSFLSAWPEVMPVFGPICAPQTEMDFAALKWQVPLYQAFVAFLAFVGLYVPTWGRTSA